jgi:hypothetical protein
MPIESQPFAPHTKAQPETLRARFTKNLFGSPKPKLLLGKPSGFQHAPTISADTNEWIR